MHLESLTAYLVAQLNPILADYSALIGNGYYFLLLILCLSAILYYCYAIYAAIAFFNHQSPVDTDFHPALTILKPICGIDSETYDNLASFCRQDYPQYQIIFSVRDRHDPAVAVAQQIIQDFPKLDLQLIISEHTIGTNFKVCNLANAEPLAKYPILVLTDSDVRVCQDYLRRIVQPMREPQVGVVTCLYRSLAQGWVANLEAVGIATNYLPGVLVAHQLEGIKFALGSSIAIKRTALEAAGGFRAIADYLADDFQLGYLPTQAGYTVRLSDYVVDHTITPEHLLKLIYRQTRWLLCTRVSRPWGYLGLMFTQGTVASLLLLITTKGSVLGWAILAITWIIRLLMGWIVGVNCLKDSAVKKFFWLILPWDFISFAIWCYGFTGRTIEWRGRRLKLTEEGKLVAITDNSVNVLSS